SQCVLQAHSAPEAVPDPEASGHGSLLNFLRICSSADKGVAKPPATRELIRILKRLRFYSTRFRLTKIPPYAFSRYDLTTRKGKSFEKRCLCPLAPFFGLCGNCETSEFSNLAGADLQKNPILALLGIIWAQGGFEWVLKL